MNFWIFRSLVRDTHYAGESWGCLPLILKVVVGATILSILEYKGVITW